MDAQTNQKYPIFFLQFVIFKRQIFYYQFSIAITCSHSKSSVSRQNNCPRRLADMALNWTLHLSNMACVKDLKMCG